MATQRKHQVEHEPAVVKAAQSSGHLIQEAKTNSPNEHAGAPVADDSTQLKSMIASLKSKSNKAGCKMASDALKSSDARLKKAKKMQRVA